MGKKAAIVALTDKIAGQGTHDAPMKKQMAAIQLLTKSWRVPLMPCPLVQPSAQRDPVPRSIPLPRAVANEKQRLASCDVSRNREPLRYENPLKTIFYLAQPPE
jgi:hypothetical protein